MLRLASFKRNSLGSKKNLASTLPRDERVAIVEWSQSEFPIKVQAELLGLNRTGLYYEPVPPSPQEVALKHRIDELYTEIPFYGSRRITACLKREGHLVNRKQVQRHMREMGIEGIAPKPNLSLSSPGHQVFPYLLKGLAIKQPNQVWGIDITYIRLLASWMYLVAIIDWYSRYVVSWELDQSLEVDFVLSAVERAFSKAKPEIFNSDQGSQFTSQAYVSLVEGAGVRISMDSKGRAFDNIFTERLWRTIKYEDVYIKGYTTPRETRVGINSYFEFYNSKRVHQALAYRTPAEVHFGY
jgi:putative transposase